jgi:Ecdysteroid kinase-like family
MSSAPPGSTTTSTAQERALHAHALSALEVADLALAHAPDLGLQEPHRNADLTRDGVQRMLSGGVAGAELTAMTAVQRHEGMTDRNVLDLEWNEVGRSAGLPDAVFAKVTPDGPYLRETLSLLHMAENEVRFYNEIRPEIPDIAPEAYYARNYPGGRFIILMEVLERRGLTPYWQADRCTLAHAKAVVQTLAQLHGAYWQSDRFATDLAWIRPRTQRFGFEWHQRSFTTARRQYLDRPGSSELPEEMRRLIRRWDENDRQVYAYWDRLPATVLHGDSHFGNTYSHPDGRAGFFDWQVMYRGHGLRDVAYFFLAAADEQLRSHEREVFEHYLACLAPSGVDLDPDTAWRNYCLFGLDALDAHIKTVTRGGYGHAESALERQRTTMTRSMLENGLPDLLDRVLRDSSS